MRAASDGPFLGQHFGSCINVTACLMVKHIGTLSRLQGQRRCSTPIDCMLQAVLNAEALRNKSFCNMPYNRYSHINPHWLSALTEATTANSLLVVGEGISLTGKDMNLELKSRQSPTAPCRSMRRKGMLSCLSLLIYDLCMITTTSVEKELTN